MTRHLTERLIRLSLLAYFVMSVALLTLVLSWLKPVLLVVLEGFAVEFLFLTSAVVVSALVYGLSGYIRRRVTHSRPGTCPTCGYDLRATPRALPGVRPPALAQGIADCQRP